MDCVGQRSEWCTVRENGVNGAKIEEVGSMVERSGKWIEWCNAWENAVYLANEW